MSGPGLDLIEARLRVRRAVLATIAGEAGTCVDMPWAGSGAAAKAYTELSDAARQLVLAQDAWDDHVERARAAKFHPLAFSPQPHPGHEHGEQQAGDENAQHETDPS